MIPTGGAVTGAATEEVREPSLTYRMDFTNGRISGKVDDLEAVKQAAFKILQTERFQYLIYSFDYGIEMNAMIGSNTTLARSELPRRIRDALLQDDRISDVTDFKVEVSGDSASVTFTVISDFGNFQERVTQIV